MKAALLQRPGEIVVDDVADPEPGPDDVRIAVGGVGLCGSDHSVFSGRWTAPAYPWIMGHEAFGTIESVGDRVSSSRVGELVVVEPNIVCFSCDQCLAGRTSACRRRVSVRINRPGALAELLVVPGPFARAAPPRRRRRARLHRAADGRRNGAPTCRAGRPRTGPGGGSRSPGPVDDPGAPAARHRGPRARPGPGARSPRGVARRPTHDPGCVGGTLWVRRRHGRGDRVTADHARRAGRRRDGTTSSASKAAPSRSPGQRSFAGSSGWPDR